VRETSWKTERWKDGHGYVICGRQSQSRINQCLEVFLLCVGVPREAGITCDTGFQICLPLPALHDRTYFLIYTPKSGLTSCICLCKHLFVFVCVVPLCACMCTESSETDSEVFPARLLVHTSKSRALMWCNCLCRRFV
jgi:hypothetical protein